MQVCAFENLTRRSYVGAKGTANFAASVADKVLFQTKVILDPIAEPGAGFWLSAKAAARPCLLRFLA